MGPSNGLAALKQSYNLNWAQRSVFQTYLKMRISRHEIIDFSIGTFNHHTNERTETSFNFLHLVQKPNTHICCDLIVSRPARV